MTGSPWITRHDVDAALRGAGWRGSGGGAYCLDEPGRVLLHESAATRSWSRFRSSPLRLGANGSGGHAFWDAAVAPPGPYKLAPDGGSGQVRLIADLPRKLPAVSEPLESNNGHPLPAPAGRTWLHDWVDGLTATLRGLAGDGTCPRPGPARPPAPPALAERLRSRGHEVLVRGDHVQVNLDDGGGHERVRIGPGASGGIALRLALAETAGWSGDSIRAARAVAADANRGLKMVRVVHRHGGGNARPGLGLEIDLGRVPPEAPWLNLALDALRGAAGVVAREIRALGDPAVARWVIRSSARERREHLDGDERR
jgi:hypothetical protein